MTIRQCDGKGNGYRTKEGGVWPVSYTHLRAHETVLDLVCRLLLEKKKKNIIQNTTTTRLNKIVAETT